MSLRIALAVVTLVSVFAPPVSASAQVQLIVGVHADVPGLQVQRRLATGAVLVKTTKQTMARLRADPNVAYVEVDERVWPLAAPNDPQYPKQWNLFEAKAGMNVPDAWARSIGSGVTVAVLDTGITRHDDLAANVVPGYDFVSSARLARDGDERDGDATDSGDWNDAGECGAGIGVPARNSSWHGTHVAGILAAATGNGVGIAGIAHRAKIQPVRVLAACGGQSSDVIDAIVWASGGSVPGVPANPTPAKVINLSLGGWGQCSPAYQAAIDAAVARGTTVVVAAGNGNSDAADTQPASCANVITVAAADRDGNRAEYSNFGQRIDVTAPGGEKTNGVLSTMNTGVKGPAQQTYSHGAGTSMAAPHVAALAALLLARDPALTPAQVERLVKERARPLPGTCTGGCGAGLADANRTVG